MRDTFDFSSEFAGETGPEAAIRSGRDAATSVSARHRQQLARLARVIQGQPETAVGVLQFWLGAAEQGASHDQ